MISSNSWRTEEDFGITIDDVEAGRMRIVGDLYHVICKLRDIAPHPNPDQLTAVASTKRSQASVQTTEGIGYSWSGSLPINSRSIEETSVSIPLFVTTSALTDRKGSHSGRVAHP